MKCTKFRVQKFRSVKDSGWIEMQNSTAIIGANESGKTNLLVPLWKLKPSNGEKIQPLLDYPRKEFAQFELTKGEEVFISARFELTKEEAGEWGAKWSIRPDELSVVTVSRKFNGEYTIHHGPSENATQANMEDIRKVKEFVDAMPPFVYYAEYGNLDAEIYLPHVIENFKRNEEDMGEREKAKTRTLKVLFDYVSLRPEEILELGTESGEVALDAGKKKERAILLDSASTRLSAAFKKWWKQGEYTFRFQADGNHFRIWVNDTKRTEWVELESRSRGLQWFFSFFLIFLVEGKNTHGNAIILLDEPGLTLHPSSQKDLLDFIQLLSETNQVILTTHSPFLVDAAHLEKVRAVYVGEDGSTEVIGQMERSDRHQKTMHPIHTSLALHLAETLLGESQIVLVEKNSDQLYLHTIKNYLVAKGRIAPGRDIIFMPMGDTKGVATLIQVLVPKEEGLPYVIVSGTKEGLKKAEFLRSTLYRDAKHRVVVVSDLVKKPEAGTEDMMPMQILTKEIAKLYRGETMDFDDLPRTEEPIDKQIEKFTLAANLERKPAESLLLAKRMQRSLRIGGESVEKNTMIVWEKLFSQLVEK